MELNSTAINQNQYLPNETWAKILLDVSLRDLYSCMQTCTEIFNSINTIGSDNNRENRKELIAAFKKFHCLSHIKVTITTAQFFNVDFQIICKDVANKLWMQAEQSGNLIGIFSQFFKNKDCIIFLEKHKFSSFLAGQFVEEYLKKNNPAVVVNGVHIFLTQKDGEEKQALAPLAVAMYDALFKAVIQQFTKSYKETILNNSAFLDPLKSELKNYKRDCRAAIGIKELDAIRHLDHFLSNYSHIPFKARLENEFINPLLKMIDELPEV